MPLLCDGLPVLLAQATPMYGTASLIRRQPSMGVASRDSAGHCCRGSVTLLHAAVLVDSVAIVLVGERQQVSWRGLVLRTDGHPSAQHLCNPWPTQSALVRADLMHDTPLSVTKARRYSAT